MNPVIAAIFLFAVLALKPTLIYCKNQPTTIAEIRSVKSAAATMATACDINNNYCNIKINRHSKRHAAKDNANTFTTTLHSHSSAASESASALPMSAKLILAMESKSNVLGRSARGALNKTITKADMNSGGSNSHGSNDNYRGRNNNGSGLKRERNFNHSNNNNNNKKANKKLMGQVDSRVNNNNENDAIAVNQNKGNQLNNSGNTSGKRSGNHRNKQRQMVKLEKSHSRSKHADDSMYNEHQGVKTQNGPMSTTCRYSKGSWTDCNPETNIRSRILTLKKGESNCPQTRTMEKKCKKSCRYEKGAWSACINGQMTRKDKLKSAGSFKTTAADTSMNTNMDNNTSNCEPMRMVERKCNPSGDTSKQRRDRKSKGSSRRKQNH